MTQISPHNFNTKVEATSNMRVFIQPQVIRDIQTIINLTEDEIGFLGLVRCHKQFAFEIYEILLPKQEISTATCELTPEGMGELAETLIKDRPEEYNNLSAWFHSHNTMGVSPSGQDDNQWAELSSNCDDFFIRGICNLKGEMNIDINMIKMGYKATDVPWQIIQAGKDREQYWKTLFDLNVKQKGYTNANFTGLNSDDGLGWENGYYQTWQTRRRQRQLELMHNTTYMEKMYTKGWRADPDSTETRTLLVKTNGTKRQFKQCSRATYDEIEGIEIAAIQRMVDQKKISTDDADADEALELFNLGWETAEDGTMRLTKWENGKVSYIDVTYGVFNELTKLEYELGGEIKTEQVEED